MEACLKARPNAESRTPASSDIQRPILVQSGSLAALIRSLTGKGRLKYKAQSLKSLVSFKIPLPTSVGFDQ